MNNRRQFLRQCAVGSVVIGGSMGLPKLVQAGLKPVSLAETRLADAVRFSDDIDPTVRLLEETPRDRLIEEVAGRIKQGRLSYREIVAALILAGIRNVQPRPNVGFKFHTVLVVNSAHLASINSPAQDRWLPIFWALDYFKEAQADDARQGDWTMSAVDENKISLTNARADFTSAMDQWDPEKADAAIASLARTASENELFDLMAHYGARDFRDIGHKSIYVANAFRTLGCIGWKFAEPILRSLTYALQCRGSDPNPASKDLPADRPGRENLELVKKIKADWLAGKLDSGATNRLVGDLYDCEPSDSAQLVSDLLNAGVAPQSIYDGLFVNAGEMLMRQPGIVSLHSVTMTNALAYAYRRVTNPELRLRIMLQNASFNALFLARMKQDNLATKKATGIQPIQLSGQEDDRIGAILDSISRDNDAAAGQVLGLLQTDASAATRLIDATRQMIFLKGTKCTITNSARPCSKTISTSRPSGATGIWPRPSTKCAEPANRTTG